MTSSLSPFASAQDINRAVINQEVTATQVVTELLARIDLINPKLNAYTHVARARALRQAEKVDNKISKGEPVGPLAGVPFAVKNLFDIKGIPTLAGSKINADNAPAEDDALLIQRLEDAGAILLGGLTMGEYAYDFTGENSHYGNCCNPWDMTAMSGGSSSGSGSATAGGIAPISLGSDTNGSIRVPSSLCGIFGLKPTYGRLPRTGSYPFCDSLDHLGPLARTVKDLSVAFDALQGVDKSDHACADKPTINTMVQLSLGVDDLRIAIADGYFSCKDFPEAQGAMEKVAKALNTDRHIDIEGVLEGRSAAYVITNVEGSTLHKSRLQTRAADFDPDTRDRFIAGTMLPANWYARAQQVRKWYHDKFMSVFAHTDIVLAPATPCTAPKQGQKFITIGGEQQLLRPNLGYFTQPISAIGLPSVVVPTVAENGLPIGVQIIAAPWREDLCLRVAHFLEAQGFTAPEPQLEVSLRLNDE